MKNTFNLSESLYENGSANGRIGESGYSSHNSPALASSTESESVLQNGPSPENVTTPGSESSAETSDSSENLIPRVNVDLVENHVLIDGLLTINGISTIEKPSMEKEAVEQSTASKLFGDEKSPWVNHVFDALKLDACDDVNGSEHIRQEQATPVLDESSLAVIGDALDRKTSVAPLMQQAHHELTQCQNDKISRALDCICTMFKVPHRDECSFNKLIKLLKTFGLRENDPRFKEMYQNLKMYEDEEKDHKTYAMPVAKFRDIIFPSVRLISSALRQQFIIPDWLKFTSQVEKIFHQCKEFDEDEDEVGHVATYIPQLARRDPELWGMSICTIDGQRFSLGDSKIPFCLQSVSKAFNYAIVSTDITPKVLHQYVGREPSGRLFNEICLDKENRPHNPLINSGAIVVTSMIRPDLSMADRFDYMLSAYRKMAAHENIGFDNATFLSERDTADRNYALSYYMKENKCFPENSQVYEKGLRSELDLYFQLCSLETNCDTLAVMAATLANGGVCPLTNETCTGSRPCRDTLSLMYSCGMYDYSGKFAFEVGMPAKSGVSGCMILVVPNVMGIALYSPPLSSTGNPCKGVKFCKLFVEKFNFHNHDPQSKRFDKKTDPRRKNDNRQVEDLVQIMYAAKTGDLEAMRRMYMQGANIHLKDYDDRTALHVAAAEGQLAMCQFLMHFVKFKTNAVDRWGRTPIEDAMHFGHDDVVNYLLGKTHRHHRKEKVPTTPKEKTSVDGETEDEAPTGENADDTESPQEDEDDTEAGIEGLLMEELEKERQFTLHANEDNESADYKGSRRQSVGPGAVVPFRRPPLPIMLRKLSSPNEEEEHSHPKTNGGHGVRRNGKPDNIKLGRNHSFV